jgi:hypothetical protein
LDAFGEGLVLQNFCYALANNDAGRMGVAGGNLLQRALPRGSSGGPEFLINWRWCNHCLISLLREVKRFFVHPR